MLAADMGGMGFIETHQADCMLSVLISTLLAARGANVERYFYSSSACVYAAGKQIEANVTALKESDAYPPRQRTAMAGKSCSANVCVGTSSKISGYGRG
jgi:hypothetical protein